MIRLYQFVLVAIILVIFNVPASGEIPASDYTQTRIGQIHSLDMAKKTAIISGYRYSFKGTKGYDLPAIKMYNSEFGAFELLKTGMKVKVEYRLSKASRIVVELRQVAEDAKLGVPDDFD